MTTQEDQGVCTGKGLLLLLSPKNLKQTINKATKWWKVLKTGDKARNTNESCSHDSPAPRRRVADVTAFRPRGRLVLNLLITRGHFRCVCCF